MITEFGCVTNKTERAMIFIKPWHHSGIVSEEFPIPAGKSGEMLAYHPGPGIVLVGFDYSNRKVTAILPADSVDFNFKSEFPAGFQAA